MPRKYRPPNASAAMPIARLGLTAPVEKRQAVQPDTARISTCEASSRP